MLIMIRARPPEWPVDAWMLEKKLVSWWLSRCVCICVPMVLLSDVVYYIILLDAIGACLVVIWMIVWFLCLRMHNVCACVCAYA